MGGQAPTRRKSIEENAPTLSRADSLVTVAAASRTTVWRERLALLFAFTFNAGGMSVMPFRYRPRNRPAGFATLPAGLQWEFAEMPPDLSHRRPDVPRSAHRYGVIATSRPLTSEELERFELDIAQ